MFNAKPAEEFNREELARIAAADQLRRIHHGLVGHVHDVDDLEALVARLETEATQLEAGPARVRDEARWHRPDSIEIPDDGLEFPNAIDRPVSGRGNPWSVPLRVFRRGESAETTVNLGRGFEGAPNRAHGGVVAAIYDDLCGFLLVLEGSVAFTAYIKVDYRGATPLSEDITFTAWVSERAGKKLFMQGECRAGDQVITTCEGLFIKAELPS